MSTFYRAALVWLLLFSLPLQGYAAATMNACGPTHHPLWQAAVAATSEHQTPALNDPQMADPCDGDGAADHATPHSLNKVAKFKCSAGAACCTGAALPATPLTFRSFPPAAAPDSQVGVSHVAFLTDGPDRPPRPSFA